VPWVLKDRVSCFIAGRPEIAKRFESHRERSLRPAFATNLRAVAHEGKIYVDPLLPNLEQASEPLHENRLFRHDHADPWLPPRAGAQAPQPNAPLKLNRGQVTIFRDRWGMAHLYAAREEDGFFGLGYATAEDRLDQVLLLYLGVRGELAAAFGPGPIGADKVGPLFGGEIPDTVASDLRMKKFQILEQARLNLAKIPPQYRLDLKAYIAGINQFHG
jgi:hypothetical protein